MSKTRPALAVATIALTAAAIALWPGDEPTTATTTEPERAERRSARDQRVVTRTSAPAITTGDAIEDAYAALAERVDGALVRCPAGDLSGGVYRAVDPERAPRPLPARFVQVQGGELTALVTEAEGTVRLDQALRPQAWLRWSGADGDGGACSVEATERIEVSGRVERSDGAPVAGHEINTCAHGEFTETDEDGGFYFTAVRGAPCALIAFVEEGEAFGRSPSVAVPTDGPRPVEGLVLTLPDGDALWSIERQSELADQLAEVVATMHPDGPPPLAEPAREILADGGLSEPADALLRGWVEDEDDLREAMADQLDMLTSDDPDQRAAALRDAFLSLY